MGGEYNYFETEGGMDASEYGELNKLKESQQFHTFFLWGAVEYCTEVNHMNTSLSLLHLVGASAFSSLCCCC